MAKKKNAADGIPPAPLQDAGNLTQAPEPWRGVKASGETVVRFFRRVWGPYLKHGLTSEILRRLDLKLWRAIRDYSARGIRRWPRDLAFPNRWSLAQKALAHIERGEWSGLTDPEIIGALGLRVRAEPRALCRCDAPAEHYRPPGTLLALYEQGYREVLTDREIIRALRKRVRDQQKHAD